MSGEPRASIVRLPDGFEFVRALGSGGAGQVVLARQLSLGRLVAVKTLHTGRHDASALRRLAREGQAIVALRHPAVVGVFELRTEDDGTAALVMEYVGGGDLHDRLAREPFSGREAMTMLTGIAAGIEYAHAHGVVHRDLKPANVLLTESGDAKVADFGIARLASPGAFRTLGSRSLGTRGYAAPEQLEHPEVERPESDWYSFAAVAYRMLTGEPPFRSETIAGLLDPGQRPHPDHPARLVPGFDETAAEALLAGLSASPSSRPNPSALVDVLAGVDPESWTAVLAARPRAAHRPPAELTEPGEVGGGAPAEVVDAPRPSVATADVGAPPRPSDLAPRRRARRRTWLVAVAACAIGALVGFGLVVLAGLR